jgi:hypothetical protein
MQQRFVSRLKKQARGVAFECCGPGGRNASISSVHLVVQADADDVVGKPRAACHGVSGRSHKSGCPSGSQLACNGRRINADTERVDRAAQIDIEIFELQRPGAPKSRLDTTANGPARLGMRETRRAAEEWVKWRYKGRWIEAGGEYVILLYGAPGETAGDVPERFVDDDAPARAPYQNSSAYARPTNTARTPTQMLRDPQKRNPVLSVNCKRLRLRYPSAKTPASPPPSRRQCWTPIASYIRADRRVSRQRARAGRTR